MQTKSLWPAHNKGTRKRNRSRPGSCYGIVKEHGGNIKVYSEIGKRSAFDIYLPLMQETNVTEIPEAEKHKGGNERILPVDDEKSVTKPEKQILERLDYTVTSHIHSVEALEHLTPPPFHTAWCSLICACQIFPGMIQLEKPNLQDLTYQTLFVQGSVNKMGILRN